MGTPYRWLRQLESRPWQLFALGYGAEEVDHIELGVECAVEVKVVARISALKVRRRELEAALFARRANGMPTGGR